MNDELTLTDLFEVDMLQQIQDKFSQMTGFASQITDAYGTPVTKGSNYTNFCNATRSTQLGCFRCYQCDREGVQKTLEDGKAVVYKCHAGITDFSAPIMAGDTLIGVFLGGQVLTEPPDITKVMQVAGEIDVDVINYLQAIFDVHIVDKKKIENAANFLYTLTNILSTISYHKYIMHQANIEIEKVAHMKSDFLANMSHEIRTPMNAVIGMAEMALREDLPPVARDYINQIKNAGKTLLTIINDILDFSKIESGKMDIIEDEYEPLSVINDITSVINTRLAKKDVELIIDINPDTPRKLVGDNIRIKQIITNLANNAVKFTKTGQVKLSYDFRELNSDFTELMFSVEDTGIGIKKNDLERLFESFHQLDSKRNRNIEGTGLGLTISKHLLELMNGSIKVESTYGVGSTFYFRLPQRIIDSKPSIVIQKNENYKIYGYIQNEYVISQLSIDLERLGFSFTPLSSVNGITGITTDNDTNTYIFVDHKLITELLHDYIAGHPDLTFVALVAFNHNASTDLNNLIIAKKPISSMFLAALFNEEIHFYDEQESTDLYYDFTAPDAKILIVDDNSINLTVAEGLLEPLAIQIDTALSGAEALEKISVIKYDLILMDHMMPEIDGIETTHIIRRLHKEYDDVPILALTANAVSGIKDIFIQEGMNDFIAKPIEVRTLCSKIKHWLPKEKLKNINQKNTLAGLNNRLQSKETAAPPALKDLDTAAALKLLGSAKLFWTVLKDYYLSIAKKSSLIQEYVDKQNWHDYTIEVHALKSASKQIGATKLAEDAAALEEAGNSNDIKTILEKTPALLELYRHYEGILAPYFPSEDENTILNKPSITADILNSIFDKLEHAIEELDLDKMEEIQEELGKYRYEGKHFEYYTSLTAALQDIDPDACEEIMINWKRILSDIPHQGNT